MPSTLVPDYPVTFQESGLPVGTLWTIWMNGTFKTTPSPVVTFEEMNGILPWSAWVPSGGYALPNWYGGYIHVNGTAVYLNVTFVPGSTVYFSESGLPAGKPWVVLLPGANVGTSEPSFNLTFANGFVNYSVGPDFEGPPYFWSTPYNGTINLTGPPVFLRFHFVEVYELNFAETGLPSSTNWSLSLQGNVLAVVNPGEFDGTFYGFTKWSDSMSTITFSASNGSYQYTASADGYQPISGTLSVVGINPVNVSLSFQALSPLALWIVTLPASLTVGVICAGVALRGRRKAHRDAPES